MYTKTLTKCKRLLKAQGITLPGLTVFPSQYLLSYTCGAGIVYMGRAVRWKHALGFNGLLHSMLHEMGHNLIELYPPTPETLRAFGSPTEWDKPQRLLKMLKPRNKSKFVSQYAQTHPEEDMVETAVHVLLRTAKPSHKTACIKKWFIEIASVC